METTETFETSTETFDTISTTTASTTTSTISPLIALILNSTKDSIISKTATITGNIEYEDYTTTSTMLDPTSTTIDPITSTLSSTLLNLKNKTSDWNYKEMLSDSPSLSSSDLIDSPPNEYIECWSRLQFRIPDINSLPTPFIILLIIALIFVAWAFIKFIQAIWTFFICHWMGFGAKWEPGPDSWAIVTGSTDGIGKAYAKAMAKKGYCVFLLSRTQEKLDKVKAEILNEFPDCPQVKTLAVDFCDDKIYGQINDEIQSLHGHVHVLVNNVGMAYKYPEYFHLILNRDKFISDIINCNIQSVTRMTHIVLPMMVPRRSGIIINLASYSAVFPTPLLSIYSASKIYMDYFSRALNAEYADHGIVVQSVLPYYVSTNMIRNPKVSFMIPSPDEFVHAALKTVGVEVRTYGYFAHNVLAFMQSFIIKFIIGNNLNTKIAFRRMKRLRKGCYQRKGLKHKF